MGGETFYKEASGILKKILAKQGTIKQLCYHCRHENKKKMFAVVSEVLLCKWRMTRESHDTKSTRPILFILYSCIFVDYPVLSDILDSTQLLSLERSLHQDRTLALILLHDHVFNPRGIQCGGAWKALLRRHKARIASELVCWQLRHRARHATTGPTTSTVDAIKAHVKAARGQTVILPRYVRVNLALTTVEKVLDHFCQNDGYTKIDTPQNGTERKGGMEEGPSVKTLYLDADLPDVIVLPPSTDLHVHPLYLQGHIILQVGDRST